MPETDETPQVPFPDGGRCEQCGAPDGGHGDYHDEAWHYLCDDCFFNG